MQVWSAGRAIHYSLDAAAHMHHLGSAQVAQQQDHHHSVGEEAVGALQHFEPPVQRRVPTAQHHCHLQGRLSCSVPHVQRESAVSDRTCWGPKGGPSHSQFPRDLAKGRGVDMLRQACPVPAGQHTWRSWRRMPHSSCLKPSRARSIIRWKHQNASASLWGNTSRKGAARSVILHTASESLIYSSVCNGFTLKAGAICLFVCKCKFTL